jgi:hypothetical protein
MKGVKIWATDRHTVKENVGGEEEIEKNTGDGK